MRALFILALVINIAWAANIVCNQGTGSSAAVSACPTETPYCKRYGAEGAETSYACGLCSPDDENCEQCVGNTQKACNKEGYPHGPKCDVSLTDGKTVPVFCAEGVTLCYSPTKTNEDFTTYGCSFCPEGKQGNGCKQCLGNSDTPCNTDTYKPGAQCNVENKAKDNLTPVDCPTDTVLCHSPRSAYTGVGDPEDWSKYGCGICPETDQGKCIPCEGTEPCNKRYSSNRRAEIFCGVTIKDRYHTTHPAKCSPSTENFCYRQTVENRFQPYVYGCGKCLEEKDCETCQGYRREELCKFPDHEENEQWSHGNIMMLNTLLLPLLLALWV